MDKQYIAHYKCRICGQEYKIDTMVRYGWLNAKEDIKALIFNWGYIDLPNMKAIHDCTGEKTMYGVGDFIGYKEVKK